MWLLPTVIHTEHGADWPSINQGIKALLHQESSFERVGFLCASGCLARCSISPVFQGVCT